MMRSARSSQGCEMRGGDVLIKVISLKFDALMGAFDDTPVRDFTQDKEVLQVRDHLFIRNEIPYLVLVIKYHPYRKESESEERSPGSRKPDADAWKKEISDADLPLFNRLRDWRSERCKKDGVPPYLIFTNLQLASIVKNKPQSLTELAQVDGLGRGKLERYSDDLLSILKVPADG